jgi:hypothetical protein
VDERLPGVLTEIRSLLDAPTDAKRLPRSVVEETLTSGYAYALALEGERLRTEQRLRAVLRTRVGVSRRVRDEEIAELTGRLEHADHELSGLRTLLSSLRAQAL